MVSGLITRQQTAKSAAYERLDLHTVGCINPLKLREIEGHLHI